MSPQSDSPDADAEYVLDRTGLVVIDEDECWRLMEGTTVGRLAVSIANQPDIFPVNFAVDNHTIVIATDAGTKLAGAVLGRAVAFEVDGLDEERHTGWSIVLHGKATEIDGVMDRLAAEDLGIKIWAEREKARFMRVTPTAITGRRIPGHD